MHCNLKAGQRRASRFELMFRPRRLIRYVRDAVIDLLRPNPIKLDVTVTWCDKEAMDFAITRAMHFNGLNF